MLPIDDVPLTGEPIRLGQFLKLAGMAEDGGHARGMARADEGGPGWVRGALLEAGQVQVNGREETRRGAQLRVGDVVAVGERRARPVR